MEILAASCSAYSDAWHPFGTLFKKFWPDCPYKRTLFSDAPSRAGDKMPGFEFWQFADQGWIRNLQTALHGTKSATVAVFQEDFFLCCPALTETVNRLDDFVSEGGADCLRLYPCPGPNDEQEIIPGVGTMTLYAPYRASCQLAIWNRLSLLCLCDRLLTAGFNRIQDFELHGSKMIDDFKICGWIRRGAPDTWPVAYHCSAIAGGKWMQGAVGLCIQHGIPLSNRPVIYASSADEAILKGTYDEYIARSSDQN